MEISNLKPRNILSRREFLTVTGVILVTGMLAGCTPQTITTTMDTTHTGNEGKTLKIIASITTVADYIQQIGGNKVEVTIMVPPGFEPHSYEPSPNQLVAVSKAAAYVKVGSGIEFETTWMGDILAQNTKMSVIDCSTGVNIINEDPHIWNSPVNAQQMVLNIFNGLTEVDPANTDYYLANYETYITQLDELNSYIRNLLEGYENRNFLIYHPAFGYFASEYNLTQLSVEEEGKETTAQKIQQSIDDALANNLNYIYASPYETSAYAKTIADEINGSVLYLDPLPSSYIANMRSVATSIALELE